MWFSSYFWRSESTSWDDSLTIYNRFSSRKLQGKLSSPYSKKILLKLWFLKSWTATFLALPLIHVFKLCPWGHNMSYFILLVLEIYIRSMIDIRHNLAVGLGLRGTWFQRPLFCIILYQLKFSNGLQNSTMWPNFSPNSGFHIDQRARRDIKSNIQNRRKSCKIQAKWWCSLCLLTSRNQLPKQRLNLHLGLSWIMPRHDFNLLSAVCFPE